ncbi:MAG: hypothetical protein IKR04_02495, partial [Clostridia bacterium]|nr:hypothetical protein [Clostridia bacterium]
MVKKRIHKIAILTLIMIAVCNIVLAFDGTTSSFVKRLVENESWIGYQILSQDEIKYTNDPEFITPPECSYDRPAVYISKLSNTTFLNKQYGDSKTIKMVFREVTIPANETTNNPLTAGLRNNNATDDLIISETSATVDAFLKQSISDNNWELYINGNQLSK